jgi:hypothetical protein
MFLKIMIVNMLLDIYYMQDIFKHFYTLYNIF